MGPDGGVMVWVPAGEFLMGSSDAGAEPDEKPVHRVKITRGSWLGKHEVTNEQYARFLETYGRTTDEAGKPLLDMSNSSCGLVMREGRPQPRAGREKHPVVLVTWYGAKAYCDHYGLALPTEAQWEWAARGPQGLMYPWGNQWNARACCNAENRGRGNPPTMKVGSLRQGNSWCGASDLAGNVWEWCADWYDARYYAVSPAENPTGPAAGQSRVLRGGSCGVTAHYCRATVRRRTIPQLGHFNDGFRVLRTP